MILNAEAGGLGASERRGRRVDRAKVGQEHGFFVMLLVQNDEAGGPAV